MKSTATLARENNVKSMRLNNTDREIFENYMTYIRSDLRVNPHDSELMLNRILKELLAAENDGTLALEFFDHDPKAHAKNNLNPYQMKHLKILLNLFLEILSFNGYILFFKGFIGFLFLIIIMKYIYIPFLLRSSLV